MPRAGVLFDVDGTLVDTNYLHVTAWWQAFRSQGHQVTMSDLHRTVGQGSDQFASASCRVASARRSCATPARSPSTATPPTC